jgi:hypothetical protein
MPPRWGSGFLAWFLQRWRSYGANERRNAATATQTTATRLQRSAQCCRDNGAATLGEHANENKSEGLVATLKRASRI